MTEKSEDQVVWKDRFLSKVLKTRGCWHWIAGKAGKSGEYGLFSLNKKNQLAHRASLLLHGIKLNPKLTVDHLCFNKLCVKPSHLEQVTMKENILRSFSPPALNARKTVCKRGHEFTKETTYINRKKNWRQCKPCKAKLNRKYYKKSMEALGKIGERK